MMQRALQQLDAFRAKQGEVNAIVESGHRPSEFTIGELLDAEFSLVEEIKTLLPELLGVSLEDLREAVNFVKRENRRNQ